jgi:hypothetical protein
VKVNVLDRFDAEKYRQTGKAKPSSPTTRHVQEVYQTVDYVWIDSKFISDIPFVFPLNECGCVQGMDRGFCIRFCYVNEKMVELSHWNPFPCRSIMDDGSKDDEDNAYPFIESFPRRVFNGINVIREELKNGLNSSAGTGQGIPVSRAYRKMHISSETWNFLCLMLEPGGVVVRNTQRKRTVKELLPFFKRRKRSVVVSTSSITVLPGAPLDALSHLLGEGSTFGMRQRWPRINLGIVELQLNDMINVIHGDNCGIDMAFDGARLNMTIRYKPLLAAGRKGGIWSAPFRHAHAFLTGTTLKLLDAILPEEDEEDERDLLVDDTPFDNAAGTESFTVQGRVDGSNTLFQVRRDRDGAMSTMEKAELLPLIHAKFN